MVIMVLLITNQSYLSLKYVMDNYLFILRINLFIIKFFMMNLKKLLIIKFELY